jgi:ketosteroid isomerase-like protein
LSGDPFAGAQSSSAKKPKLSKVKSKLGHAKKANGSHPAFNKNAEPFYRIIMEGLKGEVDGGHFWEAVAKNAVFEFLYHIPGFTNKITGRDAYMDWFGGYTNTLHSADNLRVHKTTQPNTIILEYEVHGTVPPTGKAYNNRFCSIITVADRKIIHWRDYMDSLAVMLSATPD